MNDINLSIATCPLTMSLSFSLSSALLYHLFASTPMFWLRIANKNTKKPFGAHAHIHTHAQRCYACGFSIFITSHNNNNNKSEQGKLWTQRRIAKGENAHWQTNQNSWYHYDSLWSSRSQLQSSDHRDKIAVLTFRFALSFCLSSSLIRVIVVDAYRFQFVCMSFIALRAKRKKSSLSERSQIIKCVLKC